MFYFGVDYYPEQWPEARWAEDARLMAEASVNVVRLAEFAWSKMEPEEGRYDFDWLDRAISILAVHGIRVVLGTPTASPPPWLMTAHPELFRLREDGQRVTFGNRREYCPNHPLYRDYSQHIVTQMAHHYADHPAVIGWQIDNEFGERCYCPVCARAFHDWLRRRYGTLDNLNEQWGTVFWSHAYTDWAQIPLPLTTGGSPNPGLALDFYRFASDSYVSYQRMQVDILRQKCPSHLITHNFMGFGQERVNYFDLASDLDVVAWDNYPRTQWSMQGEVDPGKAALSADTMRGLRRQSFWVMEQQAGQGGWEIVSVAPRPGELRLWAYQAIAHGADAIVFFRWRTSCFGTEQYWHGLLDHDGRPGRRYEEAKRLGSELAQAGDRICGSTVHPAVAMVLSYESRFAFQIQANNPRFSYPAQFYDVYRALYHRNILVDVVAPTADLSPYKLVVAPSLHIVSHAEAENFERYVRNGGVLVLTPRSGVKNDANAVVNQRLPGLLAELCGIEVEEYDSLPLGTANSLKLVLPALSFIPALTTGVWSDVLCPSGATVVARYTQDYYAGKPAITVNRFGQGQAVYLGALGNADLYEALVGWLLDLSGVEPLLPSPEGVEVAERWQDGRRLLFALNHTGLEQQVTLDRPYTDLLHGSAIAPGRVAIQPRGVLILVQT